MTRPARSASWAVRTPSAGPDLDDDVLGLGVDDPDDLPQDGLAGQEMLAEGVAAGFGHGAGLS